MNGGIGLVLGLPQVLTFVAVVVALFAIAKIIRSGRISQ